MSPGLKPVGENPYPIRDNGFASRAELRYHARHFACVRDSGRMTNTSGTPPRDPAKMVRTTIHCVSVGVLRIKICVGPEQDFRKLPWQAIVWNHLQL